MKTPVLRSSFPHKPGIFSPTTALSTVISLHTAQLQQVLTNDDALIQKAKHIAHNHEFADADVHGQVS